MCYPLENKMLTIEAADKINQMFTKVAVDKSVFCLVPPPMQDGYRDSSPHYLSSVALLREEEA